MRNSHNVQEDRGWNENENCSICPEIALKSLDTETLMLYHNQTSDAVITLHKSSKKLHELKYIPHTWIVAARIRPATEEKKQYVQIHVGQVLHYQPGAVKISLKLIKIVLRE